jgi:hypothetical protein
MSKLQKFSQQLSDVLRKAFAQYPDMLAQTLLRNTHQSAQSKANAICGADYHELIKAKEEHNSYTYVFALYFRSRYLSLILGEKRDAFCRLRPPFVRGSCNMLTHHESYNLTTSLKAKALHATYCVNCSLFSFITCSPIHVLPASHFTFLVTQLDALPTFVAVVEFNLTTILAGSFPWLFNVLTTR